MSEALRKLRVLASHSPTCCLAAKQKGHWLSLSHTRIPAQGQKPCCEGQS